MTIPKTLQEKLSQRKVIPFVGAGVSMAVRDRKTDNRLFPSWQELLLRAAQRLDEEKKQPYADLVRGFLNIDPPNYLEAAKRAKEGMPGAVWFQFLKDQLDPPRDRVVDDSLELAETIWQLGSPLLVTTNYDQVLKWACTLPNQADLTFWDIEAPAEQVALLQRGLQGLGKPSIWHLHGHIDDTAHLILTPDGYSRLYPEAGEVGHRYHAALTTLRQLMASYTFLFIGFSLDDAYFGLQLKGIDKIFQGATGPHYVLVREADRGRVIDLKLPVEVVTFTDHGAPLLELLQAMAEIAALAITPATPGFISTASPSAATSGPTPPPTSGGSVSATPPPILCHPDNPYFYVPYRPKGDGVIGREEALDKVRRELTRVSSVAIGQAVAFSGLGGLGKTQLAVEYAYRYQGEYPNGVFWLNADGDIAAQLTDLAVKACWIAAESEHHYKLEVARQRLRTYSHCLIIFDNLEDRKAIEEYLPDPQAHPHILITSREEQPGFIPIGLDPLDEDQSLTMLLKEAGREPEGEAEWQAAREIAGTLGGLPLALELAGAYLRYRPVGWGLYRDLLQESLRAALPGRMLASFTKHESDLYSTLKINDALLDQEPPLREILDILTWSGSAPMGLDLLGTLLGGLTPAAMAGALGLGLSLRLLQKTSQSERYAIHRLVAQVRREDLSLEECRDWVKPICQRLGKWFQSRREDFPDLPQYEAEIDHLRAWQGHALQCALEEAPRLTWLQAYPPFHRGRYIETREWLAQAFYLYEQCKKDDQELLANLLNDLGVICSCLGNYLLALEYYERALSIRQRILDEEHPDTAMSLNNIGSIYGHLGDYQQELKYCLKALAIRQKVLGEEDPDTASSLNSVGHAYGNLGKYQQELEYFLKVLEIRQKVLGEEHPLIATSMQSVGTAFGKAGDHKRQLEYNHKALAIRLKVLGEEHPFTSIAYSNLGLAYDSLGDHKQALELCQKALAIQKKVLGEDHPEFANSLNNLGTIYSNLGDHQEALSYELRALTIWQKVLGESHPITGIGLANVGLEYRKLGKFGEARDYLDRALKVRRDRLGLSHPHTVENLKHLSNALVRLNRPLAAIQVLNEFLALLPRDDPAYEELEKKKSQIHPPGFRHQSGDTKKKPGGKGKKKRR